MNAYDEQQVVEFQQDAQACYAEAGQELDLAARFAANVRFMESDCFLRDSGVCL
jgi:hypothetical protein